MEKNTLCTNKICVICVIFARTKFIIFPETFIFLFIHFFSEGGRGEGRGYCPLPSATQLVRLWLQSQVCNFFKNWQSDSIAQAVESLQMLL